MFSVTYVIELLGTVAFAVSGAFSAMQKRLDAFGVLVIAFITAIGGGTLRDVLIGYTPVSWMRSLDAPVLITATALLAILFKNAIKSFKITLFLFDALGLGLFTLIGIQKGIDAGLSAGICVILGTITGCFGGVLRDMMLNHIPAIFQRKEIYATTCIVGGAIYFALLPVMNADWAKIIAITVVCSLRILAVKYNIRLPVA